MEFEVLKKSHLKRNILIGVLIVGVFCTVVLNLTRAKYRVTESIPLVTGTINYKVSDFNLVSLYIANEEGEYVEADTIPSSGYALNTEQSYCGISNNGEIIKDERVILNYENGSMTFSNVTKKGTKCYLYFDAKLDGINYILSKYDTILTRTDFSTTVTETTTGTIYKSLDETQYDDDGEVYYFAGNPTDNWVYFAGFYWRIIRLNGNGSIRMIYSGNVSSGPVKEGESTQIGTSAFNTNAYDNAYVGYMYGTPGSNTYEETHANINDSTVKQKLDEWYANGSGLINYTQYLDDESGFCGDRTSSTNSSVNNNSGGMGKTITYYGAYIRLVSNKDPILKCPNKNKDLYTTSGSKQGNKALTYPIGLISADETAFAGGLNGNGNAAYYLYTGEYNWMFSPAYYNNDRYAVTFFVDSTGYLDFEYSSVDVEVYGIRPVINLKGDLNITGSGTTTVPYKVEGI